MVIEEKKIPRRFSLTRNHSECLPAMLQIMLTSFRTLYRFGSVRIRSTSTPESRLNPLPHGGPRNLVVR